MNERTTVSKFSISIPADLSSFLEQYQKDHGLSRSEAVSKGLEKLREAELAKAYQDQAKDWETDPEKDFWDKAALDDGLNNEESNW